MNEPVHVIHFTVLREIGVPIRQIKSGEALVSSKQGNQRRRAGSLDAPVKRVE